MPVRNISFWVWACVIPLVLGPARTTAQTPDPAKTSAFTPEQMVEEALHRFDAGEYNEAFSFVQKVKALKPDLDKLKLVEGLLMLESRPPRVPEAIQRLTEYNNSNEGKNDYRGNAAVGKIYKESRWFQLAIRPLEKAKQLAPLEQDGKPLRAQITMDLAESHFGLKKEKQAITLAKEAEAMSPNDPGIQIQLGRIAVIAKDYETAIRAADRAVGMLNARTKTNPFKTEDLRSMHDCIELKTKTYEAKITEKANDASAFYELSVTLREKAVVERRLNLLRARELGLKGIAIDPKLYKLQVFIAGIEAELGGLQEALDRLNEVVNNDPNNQAAIKLRSEIKSQLAAPQP